MDATAIKEIERLAIEANGQQELTGTLMPGFLVGDKLIPTEHLLEGRKRFRGNFETSVLADFASYVTAASSDARVLVHGFIQPDTRAAVAFLNLGTPEKPGHGDWRAHLSLVKTAGYAALAGIEQKRFTQRELAEWCEDWANYLVAPGDQTMAAAIAAIRNVTVTAIAKTNTQDEQFKASRSSLESVEVESQASKLPETLTFRTEPHPGFDRRDFLLRVNLGSGPDEKPRFALRVKGKEEMEESIAEEFKAKLAAAITGTTFTIGTFKP
jgi:uncharacterized protein YfdQ (DUF2303 family)